VNVLNKPEGKKAFRRFTCLETLGVKGNVQAKKKRLGENLQ